MSRTVDTLHNFLALNSMFFGISTLMGVCMGLVEDPEAVMKMLPAVSADGVEMPKDIRLVLLTGSAGITGLLSLALLPFVERKTRN